MAKNTLTFTPDGANYKASFEVGAAFRLHLESSQPMTVSIAQKDPDGTGSEPAKTFADVKVMDRSFGDPFGVYPLTVIVTCSQNPSQSFYRENDES